MEFVQLFEVFQPGVRNLRVPNVQPPESRQLLKVAQVSVRQRGVFDGRVVEFDDNDELIEKLKELREEDADK